MTNQEKTEMLKDTIRILYENEGRSFSYMSRLLGIDRKAISDNVKKWGFKPAHVARLTPSNQKFANRNKDLIISRFRDDVPETEIAKELGVTRDYLRNIVAKTASLKKERDDYVKRIHDGHKKRVENKKDKSTLEYDPRDIPGELWKPVLGHEDYFVSNMGRIKTLAKRYGSYYLVKSFPNSRNGRIYVKLGKQNLQVARLVGFAFVDGHCGECNTIDHKDGNVFNNRWDNLCWVSQSDNNKNAYKMGRKANRAYERRKKAKKYVIDGKYEFKTIGAMARFLGVSWTQASRYIDGECKSAHEISVIY